MLPSVHPSTTSVLRRGRTLRRQAGAAPGAGAVHCDGRAGARSAALCHHYSVQAAVAFMIVVLAFLTVWGLVVADYLAYQ
jgi:hypothetical protein